MNKSTGIGKHIKIALLDKGMAQTELAESLEQPVQSIYNMFQRDSFTMKTVNRIADALNCEVVLQDKETGKIY